MRLIITLLLLPFILLSKDILIKVNNQNIPNVRQVIKKNKNKIKFLNAEQESLLEELNKYYLIDENNINNLNESYEIIPNPTYKVEQIITPEDELFESQWELRVTNALQAWRYSTGEGIIIGLIDTGVDYEHEDLVESLWINELEDINNNGRFDDWSVNETRDGVEGDLDGIDQDGNGFTDDVIGYDMVDQSNSNFGDWNRPDPVIFDEGRHGTSVAGVMVASANKKGIRGLAYNSKLLTVRAFDAAGEGESDDIAAGIVYAVLNGAKVLNFSFGEPYSSPILRDAIKFAYSMGVVMVSSSGNNGWNRPHFPSDYPEVICVGGTNSGNGLYGFSNYGSFLDIMAPGSFVLSTEPFINGYERSSGTSMASPFVAASAALLLSNNSSLSPSQVRSILQTTAFDLGESAWDTQYGAGLVNPFAALSGNQSANIDIEFPNHDDYFNKANSPKIEVKGSTNIPLFDKWELYIGRGYYPDNITIEDELEIAEKLGITLNEVIFLSDEEKLSHKWTLVDSSSLSVKHGSLGEIDVTSLKDTTYTVRLVVRTKNKSALERRVKIRVSNNINKLRFESHKIATAINNGIEEYYFAGVANQDCDVRIKAINQETRDTFYFSNKNFGGSKHFVLMDGLPNGDYNFEINGETQYNETTLVSSFAKVNRKKIDKNSFVRKPYSFRRSYQLNDIANFNSENPQFIVNDLSNLEIDKTFLFEFNNGEFKVIDSLNSTHIPIDYADFDGDGKEDILTSTLNETEIFLNNGDILNNQKYKSPIEDIEWAEDSYDVNNDGKNEIFCTNFSNYIMKEFRNGQFVTTDSIFPTEVTANVGFERGGIVDDFDNDGKAEIILSTRLGTMHVYEYDGISFEHKNDILDQISLSRQFTCKVDFPDGQKGFLILNYGERVLFNEIGSGRSIWTARLYKNDGDNSFYKFWEKEFVGVRDGVFGLNPFSYKNGVSAGNLDNEAGDEIVISTFPNLYIFKINDKSLEAIYHNEAALSNATMIYDFDQNSINEITITTSFGTEIYENRLNSIPSVFVVDAYALGQNSGLIKWQENDEFDGVEVLEIINGNADFRYDISEGDSVVIDNLLPNTNYLYTLVAYKIINNQKVYGNPLNFGDLVEIITHDLISATEINKIGANFINIQFNGALPLNEIQSQYFELGNQLNIINPSKVLTNESNEAILIFADSIPQGDYKLIIKSFRDKFNSPTNPAEFDIKINYDIVQEVYLKRLELQGKSLITIEFSEEVALGADIPSNYILRPFGYVFSVDTIPNEAHKVQLNLDRNTGQAVGQNYTIQVINVFSKDGKPMTDGPGNTLGFTFSASELENCFVYPNPIKLKKHDIATIANLTTQAEVTIFNERGNLIRTLSERDGNGGVEWDLKDNNGQKINVGIYFYKVVGVNDQGIQYESNLFKFAVIP